MSQEKNKKTKQKKQQKVVIIGLFETKIENDNIIFVPLSKF